MTLRKDLIFIDSVSYVQNCGRDWGCSREQDNHRLVLVLLIVLWRELDNNQRTTQILTGIVKVGAMKKHRVL